MLFVHEQNVKTKIESNYHGIGELLKEFYNVEYLPVKKQLLDIDFSKGIESFKKGSIIINDYLKKLSEFSSKNDVDAHSKFRSSFLEEISAYLFKDNEYLKSEVLGIYNKGIYTGMKIDSSMNVQVLKKDVDFCIGKKCEVKINDRSVGEIIIPIVAVEVKTYLDGTMFGEVQHSSKQIKNATPNAKTYILMETNKVGVDKIIATRYDNNINEMFVLRFQKKYPIVAEVLYDYYGEISEAINNLYNEDEVKVPGRLINIEKNS